MIFKYSVHPTSVQSSTHGWPDPPPATGAPAQLPAVSWRSLCHDVMASRCYEEWCHAVNKIVKFTVPQPCIRWRAIPSVSWRSCRVLKSWPIFIFFVKFSQVTIIFSSLFLLIIIYTPMFHTSLDTLAPWYCIRIRTRWGIYGQIYPFTWRSSESKAEGTPEGKGVWLTVYSELSPNTDSISLTDPV